MLSSIDKKILSILAHSLFGKDRQKLNTNENEIINLLDEARAQSIFPIVFSDIQDEAKEILHSAKYEEYSNAYFMSLISNVQNHEDHSEIHRLMTNANIPYCIIKGAASASYYPEPSLRSMGDIDFIVQDGYVEKACKVIESAGFTTDEKDFEGIHIAYHRKPCSIIELHRAVNGIPDGNIGELISKDIEAIYSTSEKLTENANCQIPDKYYHGIILLLHTISHLISEGVGLRHLCDWAVFVDSFDEEEFVKIFEAKLKSYGIWKFAQALTLVCIYHLNIRKQKWAIQAIESGELSARETDFLLSDIITGGNFGRKDMNRYREIKYISGGQNYIDNRGITCQVFKSLNRKVYDNYKVIDRHKYLLPAGWLIEGVKYIKLLLTGRRKSSGTYQMLKEASKRKEVYNGLQIFEESK